MAGAQLLRAPVFFGMQPVLPPVQNGKVRVLEFVHIDVNSIQRYTGRDLMLFKKE